MHDLTQGSIRGHVLRMMLFMLTALVVQTLYSLIDLYWVGHLGQEAIAAVGLSGNLMFVVLALSQMITVGTVALVSQATGRKARDEVQHLFNQSQSLSACAGVLFTVVGLALVGVYADALSGDAVTAGLARDFLHWFIPGMGLSFGMIGIIATLRGVGDMRPGLIAQVSSVLLNIALAPVLIFGWLGAPRMGVAGAGAATCLATFAAVAYLLLHVIRRDHDLRIEPARWRPQWRLWARLLGIGLPAGIEFMIIAFTMSLIYLVIRRFGADAQAAFGIGQRVMQACFMPAVAIGLGVAAVVGQNLGARRLERVRESFFEAARLVIGFMAVFTLLCHFVAAPLVGLFTGEPAVVAIGAGYLAIVAWTFVGSGLAFVAGGVFQGLGNTWPSLLASVARLVGFVVPTLWLARRPDLQLPWIWWASLAAVVVQVVVALGLLHRAFAARGIVAAAPGARAAAGDREP